MSIADEIRMLELQLFEPEKRHDKDFVDRVLAPDFREIGQSGTIYNRAAMVARLLGEAKTSGTRTMADFETQDVAPGLALATYRVVENGAVRSSLWRKDGANWQLVFHQGTRPFKG